MTAGSIAQEQRDVLAVVLRSISRARCRSWSPASPSSARIAETTMVSANAGSRVTSRRWPACTRCVSVPKPGCVTRSSYSLSGKSMAKAPAASVATLRTLAMETVAPGMGVPVGSLTVRLSVAAKTMSSRRPFAFPTPVLTGSGSAGLISGRKGHPEADGSLVHRGARREAVARYAGSSSTALVPPDEAGVYFLAARYAGSAAICTGEPPVDRPASGRRSTCALRTRAETGRRKGAPAASLAASRPVHRRLAGATPPP